MVKESSQPQIKIPKVKEEDVTSFPEGTIGIINKRFDEIHQVISGINLVVVLALIAIIISVIGLFLDQIRYNNTAYKEYSEKININNSLKESNNELLNQNKQNQELILKQQNQIIELLNKK